MPRRARQISETGIYHIVLRGVNRQTIFEDEEDNERYLSLLKRYKEICGYKLYAYCLMSNHIHLLLKAENESISVIVQRIASSYVHWYNLKYCRVGHLYQSRFSSEPIDNDRYFLAVLRYIHQNPVHAGLCKDATDYRYSSHRDYIECDSGLVDIEFVFSMMDKDAFIRLNNEPVAKKCLDDDYVRLRLNDADAKIVMHDVSKCTSAAEFQSLCHDERNHYITELKERGLSIRQISRLTGVSFAIVRKA